MEKRCGIKKLFAFALFTCVLLIPLSFAIAGNPPPGWKPMGPAVVADMYFTPYAFTGQGRCKGFPVDILINIVVDEDLFDDVNKEYLLDQFLPFGKIQLFHDGLPAYDCIPEDAGGMFVQAVPDFNEVDGTTKTARLILLFVR